MQECPEKLPSSNFLLSAFYPTYIQFSSQNKNTVKVHRVFPSHCFYLVSATKITNSLVYCKRTVWKSLSRFMHVGTYPTRNFSYLRTCQGYGCLVVWAISLYLLILLRKHSPSPYQTRGRPQTFYFLFYKFATSCVFIKQSPPRL